MKSNRIVQIGRLACCLTLFLLSESDSLAAPQSPFHEGATANSDGWWHSDWFGWFNEQGTGWTYHLEHGFQYTPGTNPDSIYLYDSGTRNWFWTSEAAYPNMFRFGKSTRGYVIAYEWFNYNTGGTPGERSFLNLKYGTTMTEPEMIPFPPEGPTNFTASNITSSSVHLNWTDNSINETEFIVGRLLTFPYPSMKTHATLPVNVESCILTDLEPDTTYTFYVWASNTIGMGRSEGVTITTSGSGNMVASPTNLEITDTTIDSATLKWKDNATNETAYHISISTEGEAGPFIELPALPANLTGEPVTQLAPCKTYWFKVRAKNGNYTSEYSNVVSHTVSTTGIIFFENSLISPFSPSFGIPVTTGCWDNSTAQGGIALYDDDANHILDNVAGSSSYVFPRQPIQAGAGSSDWYLREGTHYEGNANLVLFFRFSSFFTYQRDQFLALHLNIHNNTVTPVSLFGGDMSNPINGLYGPEDGIVMSGEVFSSNMTLRFGQLPTQETGLLQGFVGAFISFTRPALGSETQVIYNADVYIEFNVPIYND